MGTTAVYMYIVITVMYGTTPTTTSAVIPFANIEKCEAQRMPIKRHHEKEQSTTLRQVTVSTSCSPII